MRISVLLLILVCSSACTSMLLGNASSGDGGAPADSRSSAQVSTDNSISAGIRRKLSADALVNQYPIGVRSLDSVVTLTGTVGSFAARDRAVEIANETNRVREVRNRIVVNTNL